MKILVLPDIHGREFWKEPCSHHDDFDKIVFLGDYMDPYSFEQIPVKQAIENFKEILDFAEKHSDKVDLLLGNHDMPYFSKKYKSFSWYHSRHSQIYSKDISEIFTAHKDMFKIACTYDDILFTHAGCTPGWIMTVFTDKYTLTSLDDLVFSLNNLLNTDKGLGCLYMVSLDRGGRDKYASCIWADASDTMRYQEQLEDILNNPDSNVPKLTFDIMQMKQVFGHTLQAYGDASGGILFGEHIELMNNKMLDNGHAFELDTENFTVKQL